MFRHINILYTVQIVRVQIPSKNTVEYVYVYAHKRLKIR